MKTSNWKLMVALAIAMLTGITACEDFLDKEPLVGTTEANFYKTEADAVNATISAYSTLQAELSPSGHFRWFWGDVVSDDATKGGSGDNDVFSLLLLEQFQGTAANELLQSEWKADYNGIAKANIVLEKIPDIDMDEQVKNRLLAEAKFIRAWFYYNLVTLWGDVPLVTTSLTAAESTSVVRAPANDIWKQIETDLTDAAAALPYRSQVALAELGRATKGAANGLLTKAYLWQGKWAEAQAAAEQIVFSGEYFLDPDYTNIFTLAGENGPGSVFEIQYMNAGNGDWGRFTEGTLSNVFQRARGAFGGFGFNLPTANLVGEYEPGDQRMFATIFFEGDNMGDRGTFTKDAAGFPHDFYSRKYFINRSEEAPTGDPNVNGPSNDRVIRYADVLLMHAEAAYHNGNEAAALSSINQVRQRARGSSVGVLPDRTSSGDALLQHIYHERRVELALEGHRFFDLVRTGRAGEVMRDAGENFVDGVHELFPVPLSEIQATNGGITQNPGY